MRASEDILKIAAVTYHMATTETMGDANLDHHADIMECLIKELSEEDKEKLERIYANLKI